MKLTDNQARQMAANAVNASVAVGLGYVHYQKNVYTPEDVQQCVTEKGIYVDYFDGRMVKLRILKEGDDWVIPLRAPDFDYQSWCREYPTYQDLCDSVAEE